MSYRYNKEKKRKQKVFFFSIIFLILLLFTPLLRVFYDALERPFLNAWEQSRITQEKAKNIFQGFFFRSKIATELKEQKELNERLYVDILRTKYLEVELEKITGLRSELKLIGQVSARYPHTQKDILVLRRVFDDELNISIGDYVYDESFVLIGKVFDMNDKSLHIKRSSFPGEETAVVVYPQEISLIARGDGSQYLIEAPRDIEFSLGDTVHMQENKNVLLGEISHIDFDPRDPFKKLYISLPKSDSYLQNIFMEK